MAIREQGYRHWQGTYTGHALRWWTITKAGLRSPIYTKGRLFGMLGLIAFAWAMPFFMGIFIYVTPAGFAQEFCDNQAGSLPTGGALQVTVDCALRGALGTLVRGWQWIWAVLFAGVVGAPLVANDLRSDALYIYLAKPLRRVDYIAGKLLACFLWVIPVTLAPALFIYFSVLGTTNEVLVLREPWETFFELLVVELALMLLVSTLAVVCSSVTRRWAFALVALLGSLSLLIPLAEITYAASRAEAWKYLSPVHNFWNFSAHVFEQDSRSYYLFNPPWAGSMWLLIGLSAAAAAVFYVRILRLEVSE